LTHSVDKTCDSSLLEVLRRIDRRDKLIYK